MSKNKIEQLKKRVQKFTDKTEEQISKIMANMPYKEASVFSYNIDRLRQFNNEIQNS